MADRHADPRRTTGLVPVVQDLTDGLVTLVRQHLELVRYDVEEDARFLLRHAIVAVFCGGVTLVGYMMLNLAAVLFAGLVAGELGMAVTAVILAAINLFFGFRGLVVVLERVREAELGLDKTTEELERSREWVKKIREQ